MRTTQHTYIHLPRFIKGQISRTRGSRRDNRRLVVCAWADMNLAPRTESGSERVSVAARVSVAERCACTCEDLWLDP